MWVIFSASICGMRVCISAFLSTLSCFSLVFYFVTRMHRHAHACVCTVGGTNYGWFTRLFRLHNGEGAAVDGFDATRI